MRWEAVAAETSVRVVDRYVRTFARVEVVLKATLKQNSFAEELLLN